MTLRRHLAHPAAWLAALVLVIGSLGLVGCAADDPGTAGEGPGTPVEESTADVEYEPAYPDEVSAEALSSEDSRQQEALHSHDGEAHAHDDEDSAHDEGEDDHDHGGDDHEH